MESTLIVSSVTPPQKKFRSPYFREEGGGQTGCQNVFIFYVLIMGGGRGSRQISQMSFNILFFLEGFPKCILITQHIQRLRHRLLYCYSIREGLKTVNIKTVKEM